MIPNTSSEKTDNNYKARKGATKQNNKTFNYINKGDKSKSSKSYIANIMCNVYLAMHFY